MKKVLFFFALLTTVSLSSAFSNSASAAYDGSRIIDNSVFLNAGSMSKEQIQDFLAGKQSGLASRSFQLNCYGATSKERQWYSAVGAPCDQTIPASHIIYYAAQVYGISPKVILSTLQKEQSLVTTQNPTDWQINQAMGYGCPTSGNCGGSSTFSYQVDSGAWALRYHYERANGNMNWWSPSTSWTCGSVKKYYSPSLYPGQNVNFFDEDNVLYRTYYLANAATSSMYCYTPHAYNNPQGLYGRPPFGTVGRYYSGSYNFVNFFELWFGSTQTNIQYGWKYVSSAIYTDSGYTSRINRGESANVSPGASLYVELKAQNEGYETWQKSVVKLGTQQPSDRCSIFFNNWLSCRRIEMQDSTVTSGATATFRFAMKAPQQTGTYSERFNLLAEGTTWMNDPGLFFEIDVSEPSTLNPSAVNTLSQGQQLSGGQKLMSQDNHSVLVMQGDGNLVLYNDLSAAWTSKTANNSLKNLVMQGDGNLVIYNAANQPLWSAGTSGNPGARLVLQNDGNLVIYNAANQPLWSAGTSGNPGGNHITLKSLRTSDMFPGQQMNTADGNYRLVFQTDGNLVLYSRNRALWSSNTYGKSSAVLSMQSDGNLVLYDSTHRPLWYSNTSGRGWSTLRIQQDGNLVLYTASGKATWSTQTAGQQ
jgi:hypothetical protein